MAAPSLADRLEHAARSIAAIEGYWAGKVFADFMASEPLRAATERHLLIIAEADKASEPLVPWPSVVGARGSLQAPIKLENRPMRRIPGLIVQNEVCAAKAIPRIEMNSIQPIHDIIGQEPIFS